MSRIVMVNEHEAILPEASVASHETTVEPTGKTDVPASGQTTVAAPPLSVAVAFDQLTRPELRSLEVYDTMSAGHLIIGGVMSATSTLKEQLAIFAEGSVAVQVTDEVPRGKE
jgi:hypothetical protein